MMRPPRNDELYCARELAELCLLEAALDVTLRCLRIEHPTLAAPDPTDPQTLWAARRLVEHINGLRREVRRYTNAVRAVPFAPRCDELPF